MHRKTVVVLATLDTKGREAQFLREQIEGRGHRGWVIDTGVVGAATTAADVSREEVAAAGGSPLIQLLINPSRESASPVMAAGAGRIMADLVARGEAHAILSLGGTQGTTLST